MQHIFLDLECTCWKIDHVRTKMETIEIGAVKCGPDFQVEAEFDHFVRPVVVPKLSAFCTRLTSIEQEDVDQAAVFSEIFAKFNTWVGSQPLTWYSWGDFDREQLLLDLERHQMVWGDHLAEHNHVNLKKVFAKWVGLEKPVGMMKALRTLNIEFEGRHHRAIDDARHVAKIAAHMFGGR
jgi:inhibitor of KinA sporulation pathway (predicted exonuclease)